MRVIPSRLFRRCVRRFPGPNLKGGRSCRFTHGNIADFLLHVVQHVGPGAVEVSQTLVPVLTLAEAQVPEGDLDPSIMEVIKVKNDA